MSRKGVLMSDFDTNEKKNIDENTENNGMPEQEILTVEKTPKNRFLKEFLEYAELFVIAICAVIILFSFCFRVCKVSGESMEDTLKDKETLIITDVFYTPKRGDVIVFHDPDISPALIEKGPLVKRVIATAGEKVQIDYTDKEMIVTVTDKKGNVTKETYDKYSIKYTFEDKPAYLQDSEYFVPEGMVFVMGDNRNHSADSRIIGCVDERSVLGKVIFRVTPLSKIGIIN